MKKYLFFLFFLGLILAKNLSAADINSAKKLFENGDYDASFKELITLIKQNPNDTELNLLMLKVANKSGRNNQALAIVERLSALYPNDAKIKKELANYYAKAGDEQTAKSQLKEASKIDPSLADPNALYDITKRAQIASKRYDRFTYNARVALGFIYNDNVTSGLDNLDISIGQMDLHLSDNAKKEAALGEYLGISTNAGYKIQENFYLVGDINAYGFKYNKSLAQNEHFAWGRAGLGLRYAGQKSIFDLRAKLSKAIYQPSEHLNAAGIEASYIYAPITSTQFILKANYEERRFKNQDEKNGQFYYLGLYGKYLWGQNWQNYAMLGFRLLKNKARENYYAFNGYEAIFRLNWAPFSKFEISPFISFKEQNYKAAATRLE